MPKHKKVKRRSKPKKVARKKPAKRKPVKRRKRAVRGVVRRKRPAKKKAAKRKRSRTVVVIAGPGAVGKKRARRKRTVRRKRTPVRMAGTRRRSVGGSGSNKMLVGLAIGAGLLYLLTRDKNPTSGTYQLPPITQTGNLTRNNQANNIVNYAIAAGLAIDAITKLIDRLNNSSDDEVRQISDHVETTGDVGILV